MGVPEMIGDVRRLIPEFLVAMELDSDLMDYEWDIPSGKLANLFPPKNPKNVD